MAVPTVVPEIAIDEKDSHILVTNDSYVYICIYIHIYKLLLLFFHVYHILAAWGPSENGGFHGTRE